MNIESLIKAILVLHHGNAKQHALLKYSVAQQIRDKEVHAILLEGKSVDAIDMIITAKYSPFVIKDDTATRVVEALMIVATKEMETKLVLQTNHTECPVRNGEIVFEEEVMITQINQIINIEDYTKIYKDFELYFEEG